MGRLAVLAIVALFGITTPALPAPAPTITNAADGIFNAFRTHPLVGIGEWHGLAQELAFYQTLIRDPRFSAEVGNLVLEVGDAAQQQTVDRYVNGENIPYSQLRKVWADTVGFDPTVPFIGSINVFEAVRAVNASLPPGRRIKIWLGDPPIDWTKTRTKEDWLPLEAQRDSYPAELIVREILAKNRKALVIYGTAHFNPGASAFAPGKDDLRGLLEKARPGSLFIVLPYVGYATEACATKFESHFDNVPTPSLIAPIRGSSLEEDASSPDCGPYLRGKSETDAQYETESRNVSGVTADALLYLGPRNRMLWSAWSPDIYLDFEFRTELERRHELKFGAPIRGFTTRDLPVVAPPYFSN